MNIKQILGLGLTLSAASLLAGCWERPPVDMVQHGYRGTGMAQVYNPRTVAKQADLNQVPVALPAAPDEGPRAKDIYKNVQVLGDLSVAQFTRHMASITQWVAPQQGCVYCHNPANFAEDSKYTKVVARRMIQMTQYLNANWTQHVAETGVTCYTCHRGHPNPQDQNGQKAYWYSAGRSGPQGGHARLAQWPERAGLQRRQVIAAQRPVLALPARCAEYPRAGQPCFADG